MHRKRDMVNLQQQHDDVKSSNVDFNALDNSRWFWTLDIHHRHNLHILHTNLILNNWKYPDRPVYARHTHSINTKYITLLTIAYSIFKEIYILLNVNSIHIECRIHLRLLSIHNRFIYSFLIFLSTIVR